jgi:23S rRNA (uracil1939-C5)-methyltransferase
MPARAKHRLTWPPMVRLRPERFVAGGEALARDHDGRVTFVRGGMPTEQVEAEVVERKGDWARAVATEVVEAAVDRVVPPCPHRLAGCGGCDWQHVDPERQLVHKLGIVADAMRRTARIGDVRVVPGESVPPWAYRTTIRVIGDEQRRAAYRRERSNDTEPADGCLIAHPRLLELIDTISLDPGLEVTLRVSAATGEAVAVWDRHEGDVGGLPVDVGVGPSATLRETVAGHELVVSGGAFFQSGPAAAELLVDAVRRAAPELAGARLVLDAYAGVGLFAVTATSPGSEVVAVESSRWSVPDSRINLAGRRARIEQVEVGRWRPRRHERFEVVIADPARTGLGKPGTAALIAAKAPVLVLVSCDPVALARDARLLVDAGYRHEVSEVLDLFPQTHHVEVVTRFVLPESSA